MDFTARRVVLSEMVTYTHKHLTYSTKLTVYKALGKLRSQQNLCNNFLYGLLEKLSIHNLEVKGQPCIESGSTVVLPI